MWCVLAAWYCFRGNCNRNVAHLQLHHLMGSAIYTIDDYNSLFLASPWANRSCCLASNSFFLKSKLSSCQFLLKANFIEFFRIWNFSWYATSLKCSHMKVVLVGWRWQILTFNIIMNVATSTFKLLLSFK